MEPLAFGGGNLGWNPHPAVHDYHGNCELFGNTTARRRWNPFCRRGVLVLDKRQRGGRDGGVRKTFEAIGYNLQDDYNSASETSPSSLNKKDRIISTAKEYRRNVSRLATEGDVVDRERTPLPRDMFVAPRQTGRVGRLRAARTTFDEEDFANTNLRLSHQKPVENVRAGQPSALTSIAQAAIPLLLIAPVMGFIARCVVDYIHAHIEEEVGKRFAEMESFQVRHRPRVKRWQTILDEDRDEEEPELLTTSTISEYQYQSDPWSTTAHQPTTSKDVTEMDTWHRNPLEKESEEERKMRQRHDYEQLRRSYTKLEPMYEKFLADSGLTGSGYWRGAGES